MIALISVAPRSGGHRSLSYQRSNSHFQYV